MGLWEKLFKRNGNDVDETSWAGVLANSVETHGAVTTVKDGETVVKEIRGKEFFGPAAECQDFEAVTNLLRDVVDEDAKKSVVAFGMLMAANSTEGGVYRKDALAVLTKLAFAKAELDSTICHTHPTIDVTADILSQAQEFADRNTIPCNEWPTSEEVVANVLENAMKYTQVKEWRRHTYSANGLVIGVEAFSKT